MKHWKMAIFMVLGGILLGLVLTEALLRCLGIGYPDFYDYDPHLGDRLRAGLTGYWLPEGGGYVSIILVAKSFFLPPFTPSPPLGGKGIKGKNFWQSL
jgi:hypothetical protein